jgi:replicative DNA helicase
MNDVRTAPHNNDAEISVLGSVLLDPNILTLSALSTLRPEHFYREAHRIIWSVIQELRDTERPVDPVMLAEGLKQRGKFEDVGGFNTLIGLSEQVPTSAYAEHYARIVQEKAHLRALISHSGSVMRLAYQDDGSLEELDAHAAAPPQFDFGERDELVHLDDALSTVLDQAVNGSGPRGLTPAWPTWTST